MMKSVAATAVQEELRPTTRRSRMISLMGDDGHARTPFRSAFQASAADIIGSADVGRRGKPSCAGECLPLAQRHGWRRIARSLISPRCARGHFHWSAGFQATTSASIVQLMPTYLYFS